MDIACWRNEEGYVIRTYGNERCFSYNEWVELRRCMQAIDDGASEALCEGYVALANVKAEEKKNRKEERIDLIALGLIKPKSPLVRRA